MRPTNHARHIRRISARKVVSYALTLALLAPFAALASSSTRTSSSPDAGIGQPVGARMPTRATVVLRAQITYVDDSGVVRLKLTKGEQEEIEMQVGEDLRIRAQDKKAFDGRKKLGFADLRVGQNIRLTVLPEEQRVLSLLVEKEKKRT